MSDLSIVKAENVEPTEVVLIADGVRYTFPRAKCWVTTTVADRGDDTVTTGPFVATIVGDHDEASGWTMSSVLVDDSVPV